MIAQLRGIVADARPTHIVLDVSGVGYLITVRVGSHFAVGTEASLYTHLAVRENSLDLYGFTLHEELEMFGHLIKLPKIGPKTAMQILSQADLSLLRQAVAQNDPSYLSKMSGIGKKSAEKIVQGLKDVIPEDDIAFGHTLSGDGDAVDALIALGYSQKDAREALVKVPQDITDTNERIRRALKYVSGG